MVEVQRGADLRGEAADALAEHVAGGGDDVRLALELVDRAWPGRRGAARRGCGRGSGHALGEIDGHGLHASAGDAGEGAVAASDDGEVREATDGEQSDRAVLVASSARTMREGGEVDALDAQAGGAGGEQDRSIMSRRAATRTTRLRGPSAVSTTPTGT